MTQSKLKPAIMGTPGKDYDVLILPEAASQTFEAGEWVYLASGKVTVCANDAQVIAGIALEPASGVEDTDLRIAVPRVGCKTEMTIYHSTEASAITAVTQVGTRYALIIASNIHYVDIEDETNLAFLVTKITKRVGYAVGDVYGRVEVEVVDEVLQLSGRDNA